MTGIPRWTPPMSTEDWCTWRTYLRKAYLTAREKETSRREIHGEVQLMDYGYIDYLLKGYQEDSGNKGLKPLLLIYSFYIPCASQSSCTGNYSCAKALNRYQAKHADRFLNFLVAYTYVFTRTGESNKNNNQISVESTDKAMALEFFKGPLKCYLAKYSKSNGLKLHIESPRDCRTDLAHPLNTDSKKRCHPDEQSAGAKRQRGERTAQEVLYGCLRDLPHVYCCSGEEYKIREQVMSVSVNHALYQCSRNTEDWGLRGSKSRQELRQCLMTWVENNVGGDCPQCSQGNPTQVRFIKSTLEPCVDTVSRFSDVIGRPIDLNDLLRPTWQSPDSGVLYRENPRDFLSRHPVYCQPGSLNLDPIGLCSKSARTGTSEVVQNQGERLRLGRSRRDN